MTLNGRKDAYFGAHWTNLNEDKPTLSAAKTYRPMIYIVSGNIRFMRIFLGGSSWPGRKNDIWGCRLDNSNFWRYRWLRLRKLQIYTGQAVAVGLLYDDKLTFVGRQLIAK